MGLGMDVEVRSLLTLRQLLQCSQLREAAFIRGDLVCQLHSLRIFFPIPTIHIKHFVEDEFGFQDLWKLLKELRHLDDDLLSTPSWLDLVNLFLYCC